MQCFDLGTINGDSAQNALISGFDHEDDSMKNPTVFIDNDTRLSTRWNFYLFDNAHFGWFDRLQRIYYEQFQRDQNSRCSTEEPLMTDLQFEVWFRVATWKALLEGVRRAMDRAILVKTGIFSKSNLITEERRVTFSPLGSIFLKKWRQRVPISPLPTRNTFLKFHSFHDDQFHHLPECWY